MNLKKLTFACVAMSFGVLLMIATAPLTGANAGAIGILLDRWLGDGWKIVPVFTLIPFVIVWIVYTICIGLGMYYLLCTAEYEYPPRDENGRTMKACFGRSSPFRWVKQSDDKEVS